MATRVYMGYLTLYHATGERQGASIVREGVMKLGKSGYLGAGIYFAEDSGVAMDKSLADGVATPVSYIIRARVNLGYVLDCPRGMRIRGWDEVRARGCDSARGFFGGQPEYCVYDQYRVKILGHTTRRGAVPMREPPPPDNTKHVRNRNRGLAGAVAVAATVGGCSIA
jgi:hypothetical protein